MSNTFSKPLLTATKYIASLGVAVFLLWYVYKDLDFTELISRFFSINFWWILLSIALSLISHWFRAYRSTLMLEPLGYKVKTWRSFVAVMVGYFVNLLVPRLGEVSRCGVLRKNEGVPLSSGFGSVVAERVIDLIILVTLVGLTFLIEFDKLRQLEINGQTIDINKLILVGIAGLLGLVLLFVLYKVFRQKIKRNPIALKITGLIKEFVQGLLSIRSIKKQKSFWFATFIIWIMYYLMSYVVFFAMPETSDLTILAGFSVLIMGGLGMAAPVQGGIGAYHLLVGSVLVLYGVQKDDGALFALILHSSQFMSVLFFGGISYVVSIFLKKAPEDANSK